MIVKNFEVRMGGYRQRLRYSTHFASPFWLRSRCLKTEGDDFVSRSIVQVLTQVVGDFGRFNHPRRSNIFSCKLPTVAFENHNSIASFGLALFTKWQLELWEQKV